MPEEFCRHYEQFRKAAKFVRKRKKDMREEVSGVASELELPAPKAGEKGKEVDVTEEMVGGATLRVCSKCVGRLKKKGVDFDPLAMLEQLSGDRISVEPVSCLKHCKFGPNAEVVMNGSGAGAAAVVDGMTEEEVTRRCFQRLSDRASSARAVELVRRALGEETALVADEATPGVQVEPRKEGHSSLKFASSRGSEEDPPADAERARRARVRANIRGRVEKILAGIDEDEI